MERFTSNAVSLKTYLNVLNQKTVFLHLCTVERD